MINRIMFIALISRGVPSKRDPQWGCFEKDQAEALVAVGHKVGENLVFLIIA